jgi:hypothetical protein
MKYLSNMKPVKVIIVSLLLITITSCRKDLLKPVIQTSLNSKVAFDTPERIFGQVNDLYAKIKVSYFYAGRYMVNSEIRGEEFLINKPNPAAGAEVFGQNVNSSSAHVIGLWSAAYAAINSTNVFIEGITANKSKVAPALFTQYVAEAKFIRALSYFALVQMYARPYLTDNGASLGVPLRLIAETGATNNDMPRSTVAQVYAQIIDDLNAAETGLPLTYANAALNTSRAHRNTAIALKTRVYLVMGNYTNVITEAAKVVSAAPFQATTGVNLKLESNIANVFSGTYTGSEAILFLPFTATNGAGVQVGLSYYFTSSPGNGEYYLNPSGILGNPALSSAGDARSTLIVTAGGNKWLNKFKAAAPYTDYAPVLRYAEVLLNYAEAATEKDDLVTATALLNAVRKRSNPTYVFPAVDIATKPALINTILTERRIELLGEGLRTVDIQRRLLPFPAKAGAIGSGPAVAPTAANYIWPISADELAANKLIVPNP